MLPRAVLVLVMLVVVQSCTCEPGTNYWLHSGTLKDDSIDEPLSDRAQHLAPLLELSNKMTAMIRDGRIREMCESHCADSLKQTMTPADLATMYAQVVSRAGVAKTFKPNQWSFRAKKSISESYLASAKIVTHERDTLYYTFVFPNEHARKFIGLHFNSRKPTEGSSSPSPSASQGSTQPR